MSKTTITRKRSKKQDVDGLDSPPLDKGFFATAIALEPTTLMAALGAGPKQQITLRVDQDVIKFFKEQGKGYQRLMNFALRSYMLKKRAATEPGTLSAPKRKARSA
ncbi:MAG TPA: BrnA antitoxin family protein [Candidatus Angelobacter sp.]|jgi:uncharacterized protein (DUF4415 family)|nr:BrnA antitoxin family protein [Candidatus Angelobacter sp.]